MFYNKLNKWISILLCTSICIGSPSITSVANSISATASPKMETLDNETSSIAETFAIEASESSEFLITRFPRQSKLLMSRLLIQAKLLMSRLLKLLISRLLT